MQYSWGRNFLFISLILFIPPIKLPHGRICKHLSRDSAISVANAIVRSYYIDYCNSLLYGVHKTHVKKLQKVQNYLASIVTQSSRYTSITEICCDLHFKINVTTFKAITSNRPLCLALKTYYHIPGPRTLTVIIIVNRPRS